MRSFNRNVGPSTAAGLGHWLGISAERFWACGDFRLPFEVESL